MAFPLNVQLNYFNGTEYQNIYPQIYEISYYEFNYAGTGTDEFTINISNYLNNGQANARIAMIYISSYDCMVIIPVGLIVGICAFSRNFAGSVGGFFTAYSISSNKSKIEIKDQNGYIIGESAGYKTIWLNTSNYSYKTRIIYGDGR